MAAFSSSCQNHNPFLLDSSSVVFPPSSPLRMFGLLEEPNIHSPSLFPQFFHVQPQTPHDHQFPPPANSNLSSLHESSSSLDQVNTNLSSNNNHEYSSVTNQMNTLESPSVSDHKVGTVDQQVVPHKVPPILNRKRKTRAFSSMNSAQSKNVREVEGKKQKRGNSLMKEKVKKHKEDKEEDQKKAPEEAPTGYIHVRARRGQATDSHSLAERVRREKISERMKILQALVPGCDKVTGKALMLDEIINYVQSLQNQVEFLSMKLASVNPVLYDFGVDLDAFIVRPQEEAMNSLNTSRVVPNLLQCNFTSPAVISDPATSFTSSYGYSHLHTSPSPIVQHSNMGNGQLLWDVDEQRQILINQSVLSSNLCSFH